MNRTAPRRRIPRAAAGKHAERKDGIRAPRINHSEMTRSKRLQFDWAVMGLIALLAGCDSGFSPKAEFVPSLVTLCVLDPSAEVQVVRLARSYDAEIATPPEPLTPREIAAASVIVSDGGRKYAFRDTLVTLANGHSERIWISRDLRPQADRAYNLAVQVPDVDSISVGLQAPGRLFPAILFQGSADTSATLTVQPGVTSMIHPPYGYYYRLWIVVRPVQGGLERRKEVPAHIDFESGEWRYPSPARDREAKFVKSFIRQAHDELLNGDSAIFVKQLLVQAYALDQSFYAWYKTAQGFEDPLSMRIDRPNISFIEGGLGLFGAVIPDSARFNYNVYMR